MKILFPAIHYFPVVGGIETWTTQIAERLSKKVDVFVVTGKVKGQAKQEMRNGVKIWRTSLFSLRDLSHSSYIYMLCALDFIFFKSLFLIRKEKIDILLCQGFLSGLLGFCLSKITGVSYIITVQSIEQNTHFLKNIVYRNAVCCIAASSAIKKYFEKIGCKNIEIIPNGIDTNRFKGLNKQKSREKLGIGDEFVIMTVARLEKVKGVDHLIKATHFLNTKYHILNTKYRTLIIGDGSQRKGLEDLVKKFNLKDRVKFLGEIPNKDIPRYLASADCFCLPSRREGFGIVVLEAQAMGVPVVASNVGGIPDLIEKEKTGILVEPENPEAIAKAIKRVYDQPEFAKQLTENAKQGLSKYNWDNIAEKMYANIISNTNLSS